MPRLVANDNGLLVDRFLICLPSTAPVSVAERMESSRNLRNTNFSSFERLYEKITQSTTRETFKYRLSREALDAYVRHEDDSCSQEGTGKSGCSKDDKNIIRLAAVMHVLYSVMEQALHQKTEIPLTKFLYTP